MKNGCQKAAVLTPIKTTVEVDSPLAGPSLTREHLQEVA
jgi:hypothetical protein